MRTLSTLWDDPDPEAERLTHFNTTHSHLPDCHFAVDGWLCVVNCQGEP